MNLKRDDPTRVPCPACGAHPGAWCRPEKQGEKHTPCPERRIAFTTTILPMEGVRDYSENELVELVLAEPDARMPECGPPAEEGPRWTISATNEGGYNGTAVDLGDLLSWLAEHQPKLLVDAMRTARWDSKVSVLSEAELEARTLLGTTFADDELREGAQRRLGKLAPQLLDVIADLRARLTIRWAMRPILTEPMTDDRLDDIRDRARDGAGISYADAQELLAYIDQLEEAASPVGAP